MDSSDDDIANLRSLRNFIIKLEEHSKKITESQEWFEEFGNIKRAFEQYKDRLSSELLHSSLFRNIKDYVLNDEEDLFIRLEEAVSKAISTDRFDDPNVNRFVKLLKQYVYINESERPLAVKTILDNWNRKIHFVQILRNIKMKRLRQEQHKDI
jgi:hypothetical protein